MSDEPMVTIPLRVAQQMKEDARRWARLRDPADPLLADAFRSAFVAALSPELAEGDRGFPSGDTDNLRALTEDEK